MVLGGNKRSKKMIKLDTVKSLNDLPENIRELFVEEDGVISLDETRVRTETDVANVKRDKDKERDLANAAKAELSKFKAIGKTSEEIAEKIADLESRSGNSSEQTEKLVTLQRELRKVKSEHDAIKTELDTIRPDYERIQTENRQRKTAETLGDFVKTLKGVDAERLTRYLKKDIMLGMIGLDETGEVLVCKDGSKLEDYAMDVAKDFGFIRVNTPGKSNAPTLPISARAKTGSASPEFSAVAGIFDDEEIAKLNS